MPLVPRRGLLAIAAVVDVALHDEPRLLSAKALSARYQLSPRHLEPLLQELVHVNILRGVRGPRGGYVIGRPPDQITLYQILSAVLPQNGDDASNPQDSQIFAKVVLPAIAAADEALRQSLDAITIGDLVARAPASAAD